jgi:DNA-binding response OmpR family regulator
MALQVLLVEDSVTQAEYYKTVLEETGLTVSVVGDGQAALEFAFNTPPDLIVLDINLPIMDGFQVCSRLSRADETRNIPIVMLTERDAANDAWTGLQAGAIDYIPKDEFAAATLLASLQQLGMTG